jgi:DNA polymerase-3 subunit delta'
MKFKDIIGFHDEKKRLIQQANEGRVSHAQMFEGKDGSGHFQLALAFAQYLNCTDRTHEDSCGTCINCKQFNNFQHPDLIYLFPNNTTSDQKTKPSSNALMKDWISFLEQHPYFTLEDWGNYIQTGNKQMLINEQDARNTVRSLSLQRNSGRYRVVLVWWPEKMNLSCANKILKILEEPGDNTIFLFVGHSSDELLPTIISRLQISYVGAPSANEIAQGLIEIEKLPEISAQNIAAIVDGNVANAMQMATNPENSLKFTELFIHWMRACYTLNMPNLFQLVEELQKLGREQQKEFITYALRMVQEILMLNYADASCVRMNQMEKKFSEKFARFVHGGNIDFFYDALNKTHMAISRNGNAKIQFMSLSINVCNFLRYKP